MVNVKRIVLMLVILLILTGCQEKAIKIEDVDNIQIQLVKEKSLGKVRTYMLKITNKTDHVIAQNEVYLFYPINKDNGTNQNDLVVRGKNNDLNIQPGCEVKLNFYVPITLLKQELLELSNPNIEMIGYFDKVSLETRFQQIIPLPELQEE